MKCAKCSRKLLVGEVKCQACAAPRPALNPAFVRAEAAFLNLRNQFEGGAIDSDKFEKAAQSTMVEYGGRYWMIGINSGTWYAYDGKEWRETDAPLVGDNRNASGQPKTQDKVVASPVPQKARAIPDWLLISIVFGIAALCWVYIAYTK